jgi:hypothetical protein
MAFSDPLFFLWRQHGTMSRRPSATGSMGKLSARHAVSSSTHPSLMSTATAAATAAATLAATTRGATTKSFSLKCFKAHARTRPPFFFCHSPHVQIHTTTSEEKLKKMNCWKSTNDPALKTFAFPFFHFSFTTSSYSFSSSCLFSFLILLRTFFFHFSFISFLIFCEKIPRCIVIFFFFLSSLLRWSCGCWRLVTRAIGPTIGPSLVHAAAVKRGLA